jgi:diacylglycerol kinase
MRKVFGYALSGIAHTVRTQRNMRIHLVVAVLALVAAAALRLTPGEWAIILICIGLVLATEMLNTAIEAIVDLNSPDIHPLAKIAKDVGAGIVLIFSFVAVAVGLVIYISAWMRF